MADKIEKCGGREDLKFFSIANGGQDVFSI